MSLKRPRNPAVGEMITKAMRQKGKKEFSFAAEVGLPNDRELRRIKSGILPYETSTLERICEPLGIWDEVQIKLSSSSSSEQLGTLLELGHLRVVGLRFVQRKRWRDTTFIQRLIDIVDRLIPDAGDDWRPRRELLVPVYYNYPQTWRLLVNQEDNIVGFWRFAPLTREKYDRARNRLFLDKELTMDALCSFNIPGIYDVYIAFIGLLPLYNIGFHRLFSSFFTVLDDLSRSDIYIGSICANALSPLGRKWCDEIEMRRLGEHKIRGYVYEDRMINILERFESDRAPLLKNFSPLVQRYREKFQKRRIESKRHKD